MSEHPVSHSGLQPTVSHQAFLLASAVQHVLANAKRHSVAFRHASTSGNPKRVGFGEVRPHAGNNLTQPIPQSGCTGGHSRGTKPQTSSSTASYRRWPREHVEVIMKYISTLAPNASINTRDVAQQLGFDMRTLCQRDLVRVKHKAVVVRLMLAHGKNPLEVADPAMCAPRGDQMRRWRAWLRAAFTALPDHTGTINDLAAVLCADPVIAPHLDTRPNARSRSVPSWKCQISWYIRCYPEMVRTGEKRARQNVYRYDEQIAQQQDREQAERKRKKPSRGLPFLGKASG